MMEEREGEREEKDGQNERRDKESGIERREMEGGGLSAMIIRILGLTMISANVAVLY